MKSEDLKLKWPVLYELLRQIKRILRVLVLPHSSAVLKQNERATESKVLPFVARNRPVLDIGAGERGINDHAIKMDMSYYKGVDLLGDAHYLPFKRESIGFVWLGGVLEHIEKPSDLAPEIHRILKKKGYVYAEVPFFQTVHPAPHDFQRFTMEGMAALFEREGFQTVDSGLAAGPSAACSHILRTYMALLFSFNNETLFQILYYYLFGWIFLPLKIFDLFLINHRQAYLMPFGIYYLGQKS